ncbi:M20 family metallo-hydrolase [Sphingobacterium sp. UT-1RO-CII-1]|uniref:M20 family metallo-hydrolase n=1 Tax=Sphingobacterium sp. UT-1RO-CII-1 TaxID=2995225 RepID=UPI00227A12A5|nr:M20 family metallo-hydrolase [Sphingobacterium sp. UT-1RO-CII-1]MCY4781117.1 M20 family metallo-hydrolase [Sphingobacterium sp. UT-1RO-CII-1]
MKNKTVDSLKKEIIHLLKEMIAIPSYSREEEGTAKLIFNFLQEKKINVNRLHNNLWCYNEFYDQNKPTILLNSHHDTVKPNKAYTRTPFLADEEKGKLYGLGSNDAGGCLVALIATFLYFYNRKDLKYNLCLLASAEEEVSGDKGVECVFKHLLPIDFAIVGEPTLLDLAVAEKGLMVLDCEAQGIAGHAAREEGDNAIYRALDSIHWFRTFQFPKVSQYLGPIKMSVTMIEAGTQHNVVPAICNFVVDVRTTDVYTNTEVLNIIKDSVSVKVKARSTRLNPSTISVEHPIVRSGLALGANIYGSPTMSDQALLPVPSVKVGPGDSARSHSADEFIYIKEIEEGVDFYIKILKNIL